MRADVEDYFLNPPADSAAARAAEFGTDLTLTLENLRLTPEQRIRKLDNFIAGVATLKTSVRIIGPTNATTEQHHCGSATAIQEAQALEGQKEV